MIFAKEIETKYRADEIDLSDFMAFCETKKSVDHKIASGWDHFYSSDKHKGFYRHRIGPNFNQKTYKLKTSKHNNYIRTEHNTDMLMHMTVKQVAAELKDLGFTHKKSIFKNCFIYKYHDHTIVYYVIYDEAIKEIGRFVEIEMSEELMWATEQDAWDALVEIEKDCKHLGLNARNRMKKEFVRVGVRMSYANVVCLVFSQMTMLASGSYMQEKKSFEAIASLLMGTALLIGAFSK